MTDTNTATESLALANIAADKSGHVTGFTPNPDATAADFEVGQVVSIFSRGYFRTGVVEKVGTKNITVVYTTQGALRDAEHARAHARAHALAAGARAEALAEAVRQSWLRSWDYHTGPVGDRYGFHNEEEHAARIERHTAEAAIFLAEHPDRDAYAQAAYDRELDRVVARYESAVANPTSFGVNFTRKSAAFGQVGV